MSIERGVGLLCREAPSAPSSPSSVLANQKKYGEFEFPVRDGGAGAVENDESKEMVTVRHSRSTRSVLDETQKYEVESWV